MGFWNNALSWIGLGGGTQDQSNASLDYGGGISKTGVHVGEEESLSISTYFACIKYIADDLAKLPKTFHELQDNGKLERVYFHDLDAMLNKRANDEMTAFSAQQTAIQYLQGQGNGVSEIIYEDGIVAPENIRGFVPIHPERVVDVDRQDQDILYTITPPAGSDGDNLFLKANEVLHFKGLGGGYWGYSVLRYQVESLGLSLAATNLASSFFKNGTITGSVLEFPKPLKDEPYNKILGALKDFRKPKNQNRSLIVDGGGVFKQIGVPLREAQFIELLQFTVKEISRWFRMPLHKLGEMEGAKFNNVEMINIDYIANTLSSIAIMMEQEWNCKLFPQDSRITIKHDFNPLLLADSKARAEYFRTIFQAGAMKAEEIREREGMPVGDVEGDQQFIQTSMIPLKMLEAWQAKNIGTEATVKVPPKGVEEPEEPEEPEGGGEGEEVSVKDEFDRFMPVLKQNAKEIISKERMAVLRLHNSKKDHEVKTSQVRSFYAKLSLDAYDKMNPIVQVLTGLDSAVLRDVCQDVMIEQCRVIEPKISWQSGIESYLLDDVKLIESLIAPFIKEEESLV